MDDTSEIYSLYSYPMTRGTSAACSEYLPTPLDGPAAHHSSKASFMGPRSMLFDRENLVRVHSASSHTASFRVADRTLGAVPESQEFRSPQDYGPEPYEEYFSIPVPRPGSGSGDVQRRGSAKELIKRFESMREEGPAKPHLPHDVSTNTSNVRQTALGLSMPLAKMERKTSPLRQSFRNLLSVFKKGKRTAREKLEPFTLSSASHSPSSGQPPSPTPHISDHGADPFDQNNSNLGSRICASPTYALHAGPLLHQSRPINASSSILPVWLSCDAVLHGTHILLTSATSQGVPSTDVVSLRACTDVNSLAYSDLSVEDRALLPSIGGSREPKVFELIFDGKDGQRFAAPTVQDRAAWVSAVWDAILRSQDKRIMERTKSEIQGSLLIDTTISTSPSPDSLVSPASELARRQASAFEAPYSSPRDLEGKTLSLPHQDVAPTDATSLRLASPLSAVNDDGPPETGTISEGIPGPMTSSFLQARDTKTASPVSDRPPSGLSLRSQLSHSQSPSIVNLSHRSMVRKRLAEMQHYSVSDHSPSRRSSRYTDATRTTSQRSSTNPDTALIRRTPTERRVDVLGLSTGVQQPTSPVSSQAPISSRFPESRLTSPVSAASTSPEPPSRPKSAFRMRDELRERRSLHQRASSEQRSSASQAKCPTSTIPSTAGSLADDNACALLDVMDAHAERQLIYTAELGDQLDAVHEDVRTVVADVRAAVCDREQDSRQLAEIRTAVGDVQTALAKMEAKPADADLSGRRLQNLAPTPTDEGRHGVSTKEEQMIRALEEIQKLLKDNASKADAEGDDEPTVMTNARPFTFLRAHQNTSVEQVDLGDVQRKLDMLLDRAFSTNPTSLDAQDGDSSTSQKHSERSLSEITPDQVQNLMDLLQTDEAKRSLLMEQQADSVRYLNELNAWLEAFVSGGTAQIQVIAEDVQKLCRTMGGADEPEDGLEADNQASVPTLVQGLRNLVADGQRRDRDGADLRSTMNGLVAALNEDMRKNAEMRNAYTTESVLGVIERQRQDQERMLRNLASELSDDIRGERLRFVEAMKEATAINVQIHVEEFKKELTREVLISTQEVGRLQRERQLLEQQIADLFAFYSKQKQAASMDIQPQPRPLQHTNTGQRENRPPTRRKVLPQPPPGQA
ncbi:hypothetical protein BC834DRAFT_111163 [Gloeopeniophorella convolvens]|nr:hypothetical protein BC834DRAFT_111163 [Gloeopeniophorella convolvens]